MQELQRIVGNQAIQMAIGRGRGVVQRQLRSATDPSLVGYYEDSRANDTLFLPLQGSVGWYIDSIGERYFYHGATRQYQTQDGLFWDPVSKLKFLSVGNGVYVTSTQQQFRYDGQLYQPVIQQQPHAMSVAPVTFGQPVTQQPTVMAPSANVHQQPQPVTGDAPAASSQGTTTGFKSNADFRAMVFGKGTGPSLAQLVTSSGDTLKDALDTLVREGSTSRERVQEALELVCFATHGRGIRGLASRFSDTGYLETHRGHAFAQYATFQAYLQLRAAYERLVGSLPSKYLDVEAHCRQLGWDQQPQRRDGDPDAGLGSARTNPKGRMGGAWF